jgi:hypothetical protein
MAVITLFRNPCPTLTVREQPNGLVHDLASESAERRASLAVQRMSLILQRLEAGQ